MRPYIFAFVLSLSFVHLFGNDGIPNPRLFLKRVYFPVVETPAVFFVHAAADVVLLPVTGEGGICRMGLRCGHGFLADGVLLLPALRIIGIERFRKGSGFVKVRRSQELQGAPG